MNRSEMRRVDLNVLIVFETLMHERNLTRAAEKLFLGQPAISAGCAGRSSASWVRTRRLRAAREWGAIPRWHE